MKYHILTWITFLLSPYDCWKASQQNTAKLSEIFQLFMLIHCGNCNGYLLSSMYLQLWSCRTNKRRFFTGCSGRRHRIMGYQSRTSRNVNSLFILFFILIFAHFMASLLTIAARTSVCRFNCNVPWPPKLKLPARLELKSSQQKENSEPPQP